MESPGGMGLLGGGPDCPQPGAGLGPGQNLSRGWPLPLGEGEAGVGGPATPAHGVLFVIGRGLALIVCRVFQQPSTTSLDPHFHQRECSVCVRGWGGASGFLGEVGVGGEQVLSPRCERRNLKNNQV